jgi:hypothetical protein
MNNTNNRLHYVRKASRAKDGQDGVLYFHHFGTGSQELIFQDHGAAAKFAKAETARGLPTKVSCSP